MGVQIDLSPRDDLADLDPYPDDPGPGPELERYRFLGGGSFILDTSPDPDPVWGEGQDVLLAEGEALIIAGPQGVGKTTLAQQLALGRCGFPEYADLLGYPIMPGRRRVLYLAMDRPKQAARSFRRMVGEAWRDELDARLAVWQGPPPHDLARTPGLLLALARSAEADTVIVDSLKDAALGLSDDEVGSGYNRARQHALTAGVEVIELHHNRKAGQGRTERPTIDDLYGSTWLTSGAGSVLLLNGLPGDPVVSLFHLKQPCSEVGPLRIAHDNHTGRSSVWHAADLLAVVQIKGTVTAREAAGALFDTEKPTTAEVEKARRKLDRMARDGLLCVVTHGDDKSATATRWGLS